MLLTRIHLSDMSVSNKWKWASNKRPDAMNTFPGWQNHIRTELPAAVDILHALQCLGCVHNCLIYIYLYERMNARDGPWCRRRLEWHPDAFSSQRDVEAVCGLTRLSFWRRKITTTEWFIVTMRLSNYSHKWASLLKGSPPQLWRQMALSRIGKHAISNLCCWTISLEDIIWISYHLCQNGIFRSCRVLWRQSKRTKLTLGFRL